MRNGEAKSFQPLLNIERNTKNLVSSIINMNNF